MGLFDGIRGSTALGSKRPLHFSTSFKQHRKVVTRDLVLLQKEMKTYFVKEILFLFFVNRIYCCDYSKMHQLTAWADPNLHFLPRLPKSSMLWYLVAIVTKWLNYIFNIGPLTAMKICPTS